MQQPRLAAIKQGLTTFNPGQPCKYGHDSPRYTRSGQCVTCSKETSRKAYQEMIALMPTATYNPKPMVAHEPVQATPPLKAKPAQKADSTLFDAFWQQYPRKVAKQPALNAWKRIVNSEDQAHTIMKALAVQKICPQWTKDNGAFIPHPATWLNQHRWEDEAIPGQPMGILEPCTGRVRHQDDTRFVPCEKPGSFKWGTKSLCASCHEEALQNKARYEARLEGTKP